MDECKFQHFFFDNNDVLRNPRPDLATWNAGKRLPCTKLLPEAVEIEGVGSWRPPRSSDPRTRPPCEAFQTFRLAKFIYEFREGSLGILDRRTWETI